MGAWLFLTEVSLRQGKPPAAGRRCCFTTVAHLTHPRDLARTDGPRSPAPHLIRARSCVHRCDAGAWGHLVGSISYPILNSSCLLRRSRSEHRTKIQSDTCDACLGSLTGYKTKPFSRPTLPQT
ncbi:uncharacterized protein LOC100502425 [Zea mays]|uniref:Uncharacterized protein n=1 Tax=Zea mays TaxID=4577 RepID=C4JBA9_MAIZE|nr:uncharacterized protein LOC100502425 [Zea mays]ACR38459.1 unknown [Zea mays]|eukprot:NP_001183832.1 uncharacterized protein LOC100502425 [Zea mays]